MSAAPAISPERLAANRANAQLSTGPRTEAGKSISSKNAVKTGLTGRTVLLSSEDAAAYETHLLRYVDMFAPVGERETELVQSLADTQWRLNRIPNLEAGFFALGRLRYAEEVGDPDLLDAFILQQDAKHFKNLHLQESRLHRRFQQDLKDLRELQAQRQKAQEEKAAKPDGYEFSTPQNAPGHHTKPDRVRQEADHTAPDLPLNTSLNRQTIPLADTM